MQLFSFLFLRISLSFPSFSLTPPSTHHQNHCPSPSKSPPTTTNQHHLECWSHQACHCATTRHRRCHHHTTTNLLVVPPRMSILCYRHQGAAAGKVSQAMGACSPLTFMFSYYWFIFVDNFFLLPFFSLKCLCCWVICCVLIIHLHWLKFFISCVICCRWFC